MKGPDWPGLSTTEENMRTIKTAFSRAAIGVPDPGPGVSVFWLMVWAIAILDDADRRDKDCRRKRGPSSGPKPC